MPTLESENSTFSNAVPVSWIVTNHPGLSMYFTATRGVPLSESADFALGELSEVDGQLTPPGFTSVYIVRNRGVLPADAALGTTYAITHSLRHGGRAPGNSLFNQADGKSRLIQDDEIDVAGNRYQVVSTETIDKRDLPGRADIWNNTPGRFVVITCLQNKENAVSDQNFVIVAQLK